MKKHLIAAAVAGAVAVPAMAQVTLSGQFGIGYGKGLTSAQGFQVTDGNLTARAGEDLGGGMKAAASMEIRVRGRGAANNVGTTAPTSTASQDIGIGGRNATVSLSGSFGTIQGGSIEFANGIYGRGSAGAPVAVQNSVNDDGIVISRQGNSDYLRYDTPAIVPGLTLAATYADGVGTGRTIGGVSTDAVENKNTYSLTGGVFYKAGPIDAAYEYTSFNQADNTTRIRHRTSVSYNLGVAVVGAGYETREIYEKTRDYSEYVLGVRFPMGATTIGVTYLANQENDNSLYGIGVQHALSKRTSVNFSYSDKDGVRNHPLAWTSTAPDGTTTAAEGTQYRVRLLHTF